MAKNGETLFQWPLLKPLIVGKMEQVLQELRRGLSAENIPPRPNVENVRFDVMQARIMDAVNKFNGAPFTIQRLCELLIDPKRHYKRSDKFLRGLEKNVLVVSTVDPFGRKVVSEAGNKHLVNGLDTNGSPFFPRDSNISTNLPPVPGWVTSTVTMAVRPQNTQAAESSPEQKHTQQPSQDSTLTTNGVSGGMVSSVYADQGEQPLAVHAEEVVEETVVTMDTNEVSTIATGGGEAMAEEDEEDEEMGAEDTNASTSSSSSSSSEELSTSDTNDSSGSSTVLTAVSSTSENESRAWASIANEGENKRSSSPSPTYTSSAAEATTEKSEDKSSDAAPSESPPSSSTSSDTIGTSTSTTTSSGHTPLAEASEPPDQQGESGADRTSANSSTQESDSLDDSFGFDTIMSAPAESSSVANEAQDMDSADSFSTNSSDVESGNSVADSDSVAPSATSSSPPTVTQMPQMQPVHVRTYAEVLASSSTDSAVENMATLDAPLECDSVAGLERLVDSVDPSPSHSVPLSSTSTKSSPHSRQNLHSTETPLPSDLPQSPDEPQAKRCRVSEESTTSPPRLPQSHTSSSAHTETDASSSSLTTVEPDVSADRINSESTIPATSLTDQDLQSSAEVDMVTCTGKETSAPSAAEIGSGDGVAQDRKVTAATPSQQISSSDSECSDESKDAPRKPGEIQGNKDCPVNDVPPTEGDTNKGIVSQSESTDEPMDQE